ncbi:MAG: hypothetical protein ACM3X6_01660 [Patescibacteria group bacterium]
MLKERKALIDGALDRLERALSTHPFGDVADWSPEQKENSARP